MATYSATPTSNTITIEVDIDSIEQSVEAYKLFCRLASETEAEEVKLTSSEFNDADFKYTFTNLEPNTEYVVNVELFYIGGTSEKIGNKDVETLPAWTLGVNNSFDLDSSNFSYSFYSGEYEINRFKISFENSGIATFYTSDSGDTHGYLTETNKGFDSDGVPLGEILAENDDSDIDSDENFYFTHNVVAGTTYYLWVRYHFEDDSGWIDLCIEPPKGHYGGTFQWNEDEVEAFTTNGKTTALTYDRWNEFVEYLQDVVTTYTTKWQATPFNKTFNEGTPGEKVYENVTFEELLEEAKASPSDKKIYAYKFNIVRFTIGSGYGFGESEALPNAIHTHYTETNSWDMEPGEPVKGEYFIALVDQINLALKDI